MSLTAALFSLFRVRSPEDDERTKLRKAVKDFYDAVEGVDQTITRLHHPEDCTTPSIVPLRRSSDRAR
jgi:hypothetical protein